jgi:PAS domain S-box-containing protein
VELLTFEPLRDRSRARHVTAGAGVAVVLAWVLATAARADEPRSILLIYADPRLVPAMVTVDQTLRATIESGLGVPARFYSEYLDVSGGPEGQEADIDQVMRRKYADSRFDLVVACGESALRFALRRRDNVFPGVPMVFCVMEDTPLEDLRLPSDVTGVTMSRDWGASIDLILRLHPRTREIVFVGGRGVVEQGWEALARQAFARYEGRLTFTVLSGLPIGDTVKAVRELRDGSVVLFNAFLRDGAGRTLSTSEALALVAPASAVPIYGSTETQLGHGIVGGALVSYETQARAAGELAVRIIARGQRLGPADIVRRAPSQYAFDARQLARWSIRESNLPAGSVVRFRPPSPWSYYAQYRGYAVIIGGFVLAQSLLIVGLLVERRRRRRAQQRVDERLRFEMLLADLASGFIEIPAHEIDTRITEGLERVIQELDVDRAGLAELTSDGRELRITHARRRDDLPALHGGFTVEGWPWTVASLRNGETVRLSRLGDLPPEAARDRESFTAIGTRSVVVLPLLVAGSVVGAFAFSMVRRERSWSEPLVQRLRLLGGIFAVILIRRRGDRALAESEGRFHQVTDAAPVMMWMAGEDGACVAFNRMWLRFTGRPLAEELGEGWAEGVHPDDRPGCLESYRAALAVRRPFTSEYRLRRADGEYRWMIDTGVPSVDADGRFRGYVGSAVDVTDARAARQTVMETLALRSAIFGSLYGPVAALDRAGVIIAVNESWSRLATEQGADPRKTGVGVDYLDICRRAADGGDEHAGAALEAIESVLAERSPRAMLEYACTTRSGIQWYAMIVEPFKRPEGGVVISHIDVTRRREAEEQAEREREELTHALRVATLGELATSLAHEINQPLAAIATNAQVARRLLQAESTHVDPEVPAALGDIAADAQRAAQVIRRLRVLFKKEHGEREPVDLAEVIKEVIGLLNRDVERRGIHLEVALEGKGQRVLGDVVQLQQVLLNVLVNAAEAMTDAPHPRRLRLLMKAAEPTILTITIRDSGPGVDAGELEQIFDRFVTSKPDGLGMGLSISRSIVKAHGGRMWATRNKNRGLTVHIELPCLEGAEPKGS